MTQTTRWAVAAVLSCASLNVGAGIAHSQGIEKPKATSPESRLKALGIELPLPQRLWPRTFRPCERATSCILRGKARSSEESRR